VVFSAGACAVVLMFNSALASTLNAGHADQIMVILEYLNRFMPMASNLLISALRFLEYPAAPRQPNNEPNPHGAGEPWKI
jgi:hypothetical protein